MDNPCQKQHVTAKRYQPMLPMLAMHLGLQLL